MTIPSMLDVGLKEWAMVCSALLRGRQIILLRKGGIHESAGEFEVEHPQFLLFPTYLHQKREMVKPAEQAGFVQMAAEPEKIVIAAAGEVTDVVRLKSRAQMDALDDQHIWTPLIDMRFNYRPENPLYLMLVRAYALPAPVNIANTLEYAGCKSWVPLTESIGTADAKAVMADDAYAQRRSEILARLKV